MRSSALALGLVACAGTAAAQGLFSNRVAAEGDWSVFVESGPACAAVSTAVDEQNTRDGAPVSVTRGDSLLYVMWSPTEGAAGQVVFTGGYAFAAGSTVTMGIGSNSYTLFSEGEFAWAEDASADAAIVAAMKRGAQAVLVGVSGRGTRTQDTFSLAGFTAMSERARTNCGG